MSEKKYRPRNPMWFKRILRWTFGRWLVRAYGMSGIGEDIFERIHPPFVVIGNHVATRDAFFLSWFVPAPVWWVGTDAHLRKTFMRFFLGMVGTIPKSKVIPDIVTINLIVDVIRKKKGVVGLFPEGQQTWDGRSLPIFPSTGKLLKLLKVPVICAHIQGGNASLPRWTWKRRRGRVIVEFSRLFTPADLRSLDVGELNARITRALAHDELEWMARSGSVFGGSRRAEYLELALFICPSCSVIGSLHGRGKIFGCDSCGQSQYLDRQYRFKPVEGSQGRAAPVPPFADIRDWDTWQAGALARRVADAAAAGRTEELFADDRVLLLRGHRMNPLRRLARGRLALYADRIELVDSRATTLVFPLVSIEGTGILTRQIFEFYIGQHLYQVRFPSRDISARKWQMAVDDLASLRAGTLP
jgi:1-acyl-sn-glycerol-3-phosphate acyltransferase